VVPQRQAWRVGVADSAGREQSEAQAVERDRLQPSGYQSCGRMLHQQPHDGDIILFVFGKVAGVISQHTLHARSPPSLNARAKLPGGASKNVEAQNPEWRL